MSNDDTYKAFASRPHLVIVGAGATIDSIPNGDKNGQRSAVMKGFIDKLGFMAYWQTLGFNSTVTIWKTYIPLLPKEMIVHTFVKALKLKSLTISPH